jgi:hypothetical protein
MHLDNKFSLPHSKILISIIVLSIFVFVWYYLSQITVYVPTPLKPFLLPYCPFVGEFESYLNPKNVVGDHLVYINNSYKYETERSCEKKWNVGKYAFMIVDEEQYQYTHYYKQYAIASGNFSGISDLSQIEFLKGENFVVNSVENITSLSFTGKRITTDKGTFYLFDDFLSFVKQCKEGDNCPHTDIQGMFEAIMLECQLKDKSGKDACYERKKDVCVNVHHSPSEWWATDLRLRQDCFKVIASDYDSVNKWYVLGNCPFVSDFNTYLRESYRHDTYPSIETQGQMIQFKTCIKVWNVSGYSFKVVDGGVCYTDPCDSNAVYRYALIRGDFSGVRALSQIVFLRDETFNVTGVESATFNGSEGLMFRTDKGKLYVFNEFILLDSYCSDRDMECNNLQQV